MDWMEKTEKVKLKNQKIQGLKFQMKEQFKKPFV